jgi:hypothetical protein
MGGRDREDSSLSPAQQKVSKTPISTNKLDMVAYAWNLSYVGSI